MQRTRDLLKKYPPEIHTGVELVSSRRRQSEQRRNPVLHPGPDLHKLAEVLRRAARQDEEPCPALVDPDTTLRSGKPEVRLEIDRPRAADLGVCVMDIEQALNTLVAGQVRLHLQRRRRSVRRRRARAGAVPRQRRRPRQDDRAFARSCGSVGLDEVVRHQARHRALVHQSHRPAAPGDPHRQHAARRIAGGDHLSS